MTTMTITCEAAARIRTAKQELAAAIDAQPISDIQMLVGWCLARAFGHLWATLVSPEEFGIDELVTAARIRALVKERDTQEGAFGGIEFPYLNEEGVLVHTTGSQRIDWSVTQQGVFEAHVNRPGKLGRITVTGSGRITGPDTMAVERVEILCEGELEARHFEALQWVLEPLIGRDAAVTRTELARITYIRQRVDATKAELHSRVYPERTHHDDVLASAEEPDSTI